jgi:hypothetical protein
MNDAYLKHYAPVVHLTVHRRIIFQQYIPKKNKCFGTNIYKLCDKSGYTFDIATYLYNNRICASGDMTVTMSLSDTSKERWRDININFILC